VVLRGTLYDRPAIERLLADVKATPDIRVNDWTR
jgi:hypothetical protein